MRKLIAYYTREEYVDFVENRYLEHEILEINYERGEETIVTEMLMTDEEFLDLLPHLRE